MGRFIRPLTGIRAYAAAELKVSLMKVSVSPFRRDDRLQPLHSGHKLAC